MKTVFAFPAEIVQRHALHPSMPAQLAAIIQRWMESEVRSGDDQVTLERAQSEGTSAISLKITSRQPDLSGFDLATATIWVEERATTVRVSIQSMTGNSRFGELAQKPSFIVELLRATTLTYGGDVLSGSLRVVNSDRAPALIELLLSPARLLPVVVIASETTRNATVWATNLARALEGLAIVVLSKHEHVTYQIGKALGDELRVADGEVRVYFPGLTKASSPRLHRAFPSGQDGSGAQINEIYEVVNRVTAANFVPDERVGPFLAEHKHWQEVETAVSAAESVAAGESEALQDNQVAIETDAKRNEELITALRLELAHLTNHIDLQERRIDQLERELFDAQERGRLTSQIDRFSLDSVSQFAMIPEVLAVTSLADLVALFEQHVPDSAIVFLPEAHESARESPYVGGLQGPAKVLQAICTVATRYHFGNLREGEDFKRAFQEAGEATFAADSSPVTFAKYGSKYTRLYDDGTGTERVLLRPHLTFGSGRANSSVKVYWYVDARNRRFVIGQVGAHLPIAKRF